MIALGLNFILGIMLFCGLIVGLRLESRLKALRNSHADFAKAVSELDQAAVRTEDSLAQLRAGTEDARSELAARIDQARLLAQRLEKLTLEADRSLNQPLILDRPLAAAMAEPAPPRQADARQAGMRQADASRPDVRHAAMRQALSDPRPIARPDSAPRARSRAMVDDDLFAPAPTPAPTRQADERRPILAAVAGGRR